MTLQEMVLARLKHLSPHEQMKVWDFVSTLPASTAQPKNPLGFFAHKGYHLEKEVIDEARRDAWANFARALPDEKE